MKCVFCKKEVNISANPMPLAINADSCDKCDEYVVKIRQLLFKLNINWVDVLLIPRNSTHII